MALKWPDKNPDDVLDYNIDWSSFLPSDTITSSTWVMPVGITENSSFFAGSVSGIWLSGGTNGQTYSIVNTITTAAGRVIERTVTITATQE